MLKTLLASKIVYGTLLALFIGSSVLSILGNVIQHTSLLHQLPASLQMIVQTTGDICWATVAMIAFRRFAPTELPHRMKAGFIAVSLYFALGESVVPQLLPGAADLQDIPAAVIGAAIYYLYDRSRTAYSRRPDENILNG